VAAERPFEAALVLCLDLVVELVGDSIAQLCEHGGGVESRSQPLVRGAGSGHGVGSRTS
jgi:hypothetical protein